MARDPEELLLETADGPTRHLDSAALVAQANRGRRRLFAATTAGSTSTTSIRTRPSARRLAACSSACKSKSRHNQYRGK